MKPVPTFPPAPADARKLDSLILAAANTLQTLALGGRKP